MIILEPVRIKPAGPPDTYFGVAQSMLRGVQVLATASPPPALALALVAAHALECLLKASILRAGPDAAIEKELEHGKDRHNLTALWGKAFAQGPKSPPGWVEHLSRLHAHPYPLRYSKGLHGISSPAAEPMTSELAALLETVRGQLG
jgi:hypothetical protein